MKRFLTAVAVAFAVAGCGSAHLQHAPGSGQASVTRSPVPGWMTSVGSSAAVPGFPGGAQPSTARSAALACHPRTPSGDCYTLNSQCPVKDKDTIGLTADGTRMICKTGTGSEPAGMLAWTALPPGAKQ